MFEVARQRAGPVRGDGQVRDRRAALLLLPRGLVRPGRRRLDDTFGERYESELANEYGNLASRTLAMIGRYRDGVRPTRTSTPSCSADFDGLADEVPSCSTTPRSPRRSSDLAARPAAQPLRGGARAPAAGQGRGEGAAELDPRCACSPRASARSRCCCTRTCRRPPTSCSARWATRRTWRRPPASARGPAAAGRALPPLFPEAAVIDSHTHLSTTPGTDAEIVAAATAAGVTRGSSRSARTPRTAASRPGRGRGAREVWFAVGHHPNNATG